MENLSKLGKSENKVHGESPGVTVTVAFIFTKTLMTVIFVQYESLVSGYSFLVIFFPLLNRFRSVVSDQEHLAIFQL